jgi:hypothetical protein
VGCFKLPTSFFILFFICLFTPFFDKRSGKAERRTSWLYLASPFTLQRYEVSQDNRFNAFKNMLARDIKGFIEKATYEGWRSVIPGKHPETAFFAYFSRELGGKAYLCIRKIKNTGLFKPYAIIDQKTFDAEILNLKK